LDVGVSAVRLILAAAFVFFGLVKFREASVWVEIFQVIGVGQWFRYVTGVVETVGGALLLWPRATPLAVALLAPTMVGAFLTHVLLFRVTPQSAIVLTLLAGVLFVGWHWRRGRRSIAQISR
jgi:uncharacterized membrane protein YphA (DoxX/SURF4 family)